MPRIKIIIEYEGTGYSGWQLQKNGKTIQGEIEKTLKIIYKNRIAVTGSGRTDAGVHARNQVAHFDIPEIDETSDINETLYKLKKSINGLIQKDIVVKKHHNILLTGTTGYLGAHLLYDLLRTTDSSIYTLVRGNNVNEAKQRLVEKFNFYFDEIDFNSFKNRIKVLCGDITKENLGLDESSLKLFKNIDCIINSAANVKHYGKYEDFYNVNVRGVENLIKLVKDNETVKFYHISTKSVGSGIVANTEYIAFSENTVDVGQDINNYISRLTPTARHFFR